MSLHLFTRRDLLRAAASLSLVPQTAESPGLRDLFGRYTKSLGRRDAAGLAGLFADQAKYRDVTFGVKLIGRDAIRNMFVRTFTAVTNSKYRVERAAFDHDTIAVRWEMSGVHEGPMLGMPPSGRRITFRGASFLTVTDERVIEQVDYLDRAGLERELGVRGAMRD